MVLISLMLCKLIKAKQTAKLVPFSQKMVNGLLMLITSFLQGDATV